MSELPRRTLGRTGLEVTTLGYGALEVQIKGTDMSEADADRVLNAVLDSGINLIDTSIDYARSEEMIGKFISHRRSEYFLASKCACVPYSPTRSHEHTAANIRAGVENSLRLLNTDYLDIVQFHRSILPDEFYAEGALEEALKLRDEGKVRFIGVSATLPNMELHVGMGVWDVFQVPYSLLQPQHEDVITRASAAGAGIIIRGGAARGVPSDWQGRSYYGATGTLYQDRWADAGLDDLLDGMSRIEFTLRYTLSHPDLDSTIVGTKDLGHLASNVGYAIKGPLPPDVVAEAKRRLAALPTPAPMPVAPTT